VRIGVLGGTFDPIHSGHLAAALAAAGCAQLDRIVFVPAAQPPHRPAAVASPRHRLEMCRLATAGDPRFEVSELELERAGPSYTVDTLQELRRHHERDELFLILGWDAAGQFSSWHEPAKVQGLARIVVVARPGRKSPRAADLEAAGFDVSRVVLCLKPTPAVSASDVRSACGAGASIAGLVPAAVEHYIASNQLYR